MIEKVNRLKEMIDECNNIVFFTGAGVSTESGIKDFRSKDGLYNEKNSYKYPPEYLLSKKCFEDDLKEFYKYYKDKMNSLNYKPNVTHKYIKQLENQGKDVIVITQNIDGLHAKAGSSVIYELHGTVNKNHCLKCGKEYSGEYVFKSKGIPKCDCGGIIKPDVVLYGESLPENEWINSEQAISKCELLIVMGTSLTVYPASGLINLFRGKYLVILNQEKTPFDKTADLVIHDKLSNIFRFFSTLS